MPKNIIGSLKFSQYPYSNNHRHKNFQKVQPANFPDFAFKTIKHNQRQYCTRKLFKKNKIKIVKESCLLVKQRTNIKEM